MPIYFSYVTLYIRMRMIIEWANERGLTVGEEVGEVKKTDDDNSMECFTATQLTVGIKIYEAV